MGCWCEVPEDPASVQDRSCAVETPDLKRSTSKMKMYVAHLLSRSQCSKTHTRL